MKKGKLTAIAVTALICAFSAVSCGSSDSGSSSVSVKINSSTEASTESTTEKETETTTAETKTTEAKTTAEATTEEDTTEEATEEDTTEEATEEDTTEEETTEADTEEQTEAQPPVSDVVVLDGCNYLGFEINELKDVLGEQTMAYMAEACIPIGDDGNAYVYEFDGVKAECYLQSETHYIASINIESSSYATPEGITVGSSKSDVEAAYGSAEVQGNGDLYYSKGGYDLYFVMSGDAVAEVQYLLNY